ncbi:head-tail adaptor protein [Sphingomonas sanguinis]|uniref:phage head completion protein n=1 Tax=Sphingomonas sanguinis TaxID=33051 RepID=UPI001C583490|nr:head-tail adaptor protein [Sphingomonas sanguinis]QXT34334.1 head-tail adaptor protein [Sphingomonas sanguinis]
MIVLDRRELDKRLRIERPVADESFRGAGGGEWVLVDEVWASVRDVMPSRSAKPEAIPTNVRRSRVRMRFRTDVAPNMRIVFGDRVMQIVSPIAELGRRSGIEMMVEDYGAAGNAA